MISKSQAYVRTSVDFLDKSPSVVSIKGKDYLYRN